MKLLMQRLFLMLFFTLVALTLPDNINAAAPCELTQEEELDRKLLALRVELAAASDAGELEAFCDAYLAALSSHCEDRKKIIEMEDCKYLFFLFVIGYIQIF